MTRRIYSIEMTPQDYEALQRVAERMETRRADVIRAAVRALDDLAKREGLDVLAGERPGISMVDEFEPDALQRQCLRTWFPGDVSLREQVLHATLGLAGEAGETADLIKKWAYKPGRAVGPDAVKDELSDVLYYVAVLAALWGFTFDDMAAHLRDKLSDGHGWQGDEKPV